MTESEGHAYTREHQISGEELMVDLKEEGESLLAEARGATSRAGRAALW